MPTYDYRCKACGHEFEQFQSMSAKPLSKCPSCGKNTLERLIGVGAAVVFKGSGFYQTDYRSESYKKAAEADAAVAKGTDTKKDAKAETTKPEAKPESKAEPSRSAESGTTVPTKSEGKSGNAGSTSVRVTGKAPAVRKPPTSAPKAKRK